MYKMYLQFFVLSFYMYSECGIRACILVREFTNVNVILMWWQLCTLYGACVLVQV